MERYERFLARVRVGRKVLEAHCVNPGRMEGLVQKGARVFLSHAVVPGRRLAYTWQMVELDGLLVGVNTGLPNTLVRAMLEQQLLTPLGSVANIRHEQKLGLHHRVDFVLERADGSLEPLEVKNCHLVYPDRCGYFPDSRSARAESHAQALANYVRNGGRAHVVFTVQRSDVRSLRPSDLHDPAFAQALRSAAEAGVGVHAVRLIPGHEGIAFGGMVPVDLAPYAVPQKFAEALCATSGWLRSDGAWAGQALPKLNSKSKAAK